MLDAQEGYKDVFKFQMGWKEFLMEFQPLFSKAASFLDEDNNRVISLEPVHALIVRMAKERGFIINLDTHLFAWEQDWIYIYVAEK